MTARVTDLFWPGDQRAAGLFDSRAFLLAMVEVETAWLRTSHDAGIVDAPDVDLRGLVEADLDDVVSHVAISAESGGNPVIPLIKVLRDRLSARDEAAARMLHKGLTSQDVLDTALMLCARDVGARVETEIRKQVVALCHLVRAHHTHPMVGRTLTQFAVPITFGLKAASWLGGILDAGRAIRRCTHGLPAQIGGAAGSLAATTQLLECRGEAHAGERALELAHATAISLGLQPVAPWHTSRGAVTAFADSLVRCTDAWGHIAADTATLSRPEIGEVREATGGGSSTMPHKANPVLSVLVRRSALAAPALAATLHTASALANDERPDGAWHAEWSTLALLSRRTVVAASQTSELLEGLQIRPDAMQHNLALAGEDVFAEQRSMAALVGGAPSDQYLGANDAIIASVLDDAARYLEETS